MAKRSKRRFKILIIYKAARMKQKMKDKKELKRKKRTNKITKMTSMKIHNCSCLKLPHPI